ncbi:MAG TPA: hypothetical protein PKC44_08915 [Agitococcus sp.]|nr:hypothetical protein [Agitococcus sp.]
MNWFITQLRHDWQRYDVFEQYILCIVLTFASTIFYIGLASH